MKYYTYSVTIDVKEETKKGRMREDGSREKATTVPQGISIKIPMNDVVVESKKKLTDRQKDMVEKKIERIYKELLRFENVNIELKYFNE